MTLPIENTHIIIEAQSNDHSAYLSGIDAKLLKDGPVEAIVERVKFYIDRLARIHTDRINDKRLRRMGVGVIADPLKPKTEDLMHISRSVIQLPMPYCRRQKNSL